MITTMFRFQPIPFSSVKITDAFWSERQRVNREESLVKQYEMCVETGRIDALKNQWTPESGKPAPHIFWDSDTAKWLEAACYAGQADGDQGLLDKANLVADLFETAQHPDGYINSHFSVIEQEKQWTNLRDWHELYCAGHIFEAAVAHHAATGQDNFLKTAIRFADLIGKRYGKGEGQIPGYCGHEEIELALIRLHTATGEKRFLDLASYFVEQRGQEPNFFKQEQPNRPWLFSMEYFQAHKPVREQDKVIGHAVRAMYLYCAMTDLARLQNDESLLKACETLWEDLERGSYYITGAIGSLRHGEAFSTNYDLPNETAYCETCASVGLIFWSHRMLQKDSHARYSEMLERVLFNAALAGMSLDGKRFFYENPLASQGKHTRQDWFFCACCPSNLGRLLASLGNYVYSQAEDELSVHLYIGSEVEFRLGNGVEGKIRQWGEQPWHGRQFFEILPKTEGAWRLNFRIPGWTEGFALRVNGEVVGFENVNGYASVRRTWQTGDKVEIELPAEVARIAAHPRVFSDAGQVALQRGPFVYCVEDADFEGGVSNVSLPAQASLTAKDSPTLLGGVVSIESQGELAKLPTEGTTYFPVSKISRREVPFRAIPYYAWDNRTPGAMRVWIPQSH